MNETRQEQLTTFHTSEASGGAAGVFFLGYPEFARHRFEAEFSGVISGYCHRQRMEWTPLFGCAELSRFIYLFG